LIGGDLQRVLEFRVQLIERHRAVGLRNFKLFWAVSVDLLRQSAKLRVSAFANSLDDSIDDLRGAEILTEYPTNALTSNV
jgi:hypothetical protein